MAPALFEGPSHASNLPRQRRVGRRNGHAPELRKAQWSELDLENAVWKSPADRMKMRRPHIVPLSRQVLAMFVELHALTGPEGFVFPAHHTWRRPLSENTMNQAFRRMGYPFNRRWQHEIADTAKMTPQMVMLSFSIVHR